jgi:hypothetical protein
MQRGRNEGLAGRHKRRLDYPPGSRAGRLEVPDSSH